MKSIYNDVELLTVFEIMGILRMGRRRAYALVKTLPENAVIRSGRGNRILVHAWALYPYLNLAKGPCPACGQPWPKDV